MDFTPIPDRRDRLPRRAARRARVLSMSLALASGASALAAPPETKAAEIDAKAPVVGASTESVCTESLRKIASGAPEAYAFFCKRAETLKGCASQEGRPISHLDLVGKSGDAFAKREKRILVFGLIHGDEPISGKLALEWMKRLQEIEPRNSWRVVPILNPDGLRRVTRANARGIDLNRNFPTRAWDREASTYWEKSQRRDPRRFPGSVAASEPETQCAIAHIKDFKPDFIVSVHAPYKVLDFDGPRLPFPAYGPLPWRALGNYPGSLGRYMWKDNGLPVLTVELKDQLVDPATLQDVVGKLAIEASKRAGKKKSDWAEIL